MSNDRDLHQPIPALSAEALKIFNRPAPAVRVTVDFRMRATTRRKYGPAIRRAAARWNIPAAKIVR